MSITFSLGHGVTPAGDATEGSASDLRTSVDRAMHLVESFGPVEVLGVSELARRTSLPKSTTHRLLSVLEQRNMVDRVGAKYRLGIKLFEVGSRASITEGDIRETARPHLCDLFAATRRAVHLGILDGYDVVCLDKLRSRQGRNAPTRIGERIPAHATAMGKTLLAHPHPRRKQDLQRIPLQPRTANTYVNRALFLRHLDSIRSNGFASDQEEMQVGLGCIAAPVFDSTGTAIAAVSSTGRPRETHQHVALVLQTAQAITQEVRLASTRAALPL